MFFCGCRLFLLHSMTQVSFVSVFATVVTSVSRKALDMLFYAIQGFFRNFSLLSMFSSLITNYHSCTVDILVAYHLNFFVRNWEGIQKH